MIDPTMFTIQIPERKEPFPKLPEIAARLDVEPGDKGGGVMLITANGTRYDLFALMNAFLDRVDEAKI